MAELSSCSTFFPGEDVPRSCESKENEEGMQKPWNQHTIWAKSTWCWPNPSQSTNTVCLYVSSLSHVWLFCDPMDCSSPGSSVHGASQQEYWNGLPVPSPGDLPDPEVKPRYPTLQADYLPSEPPGKPTRFTMNVLSFLLKKCRKTRANQVQTKKKKSVSCSVVSDSLQSHGL